MTRILIVNADDFGRSDGVNRGVIQAHEKGIVTSASLMVRYAAAADAAEYGRHRPQLSLGLHVDLGEWLYQDGTWTAVYELDQFEDEVERQLDAFRSLVPRDPTHLDSHQNRLFQSNKDLFEVLLRVAHENNLPVLIPRGWFADFPFLEKSIGPSDVVIDRVITIEPGVPPSKWNDFYKDSLNHLEPGVTEFVIHLAYADAEMKAATRERDTWGADWRQRDFDFFSSAEFQKLLRDNKIHLITWRDVGRTMNPPAKSE